MNRLMILGLGYSGQAVAAAARAAGFQVTGTHRVATADAIAFDAAGPAIAAATHLLATAGPEADGDPVLVRYGTEIRAASGLRWIGYLSSTVVYGNRDGEWVEETTPPAPTQSRGQRRVEAENAWRALAAGGPCVDLFRLAGIYGPGRSAFDDLRAGRARRTIKPGHMFGRIHRDDIGRAVVAAMTTPATGAARVFNLSDDEPAESAAVMEEAAHLLGVPPPPAMAFEDAWQAMSPMARSFWAENRKVSAAATKAALGIEWRYPTYREGLRAILAEEQAG